MADDKTLQILTAVVVISMVLTPFILKNVSKIADSMEEQDELMQAVVTTKEQDEIEELVNIDIPEYKNHFQVLYMSNL